VRVWEWASSAQSVDVFRILCVDFHLTAVCVCVCVCVSNISQLEIFENTCKRPEGGNEECGVERVNDEVGEVFARLVLYDGAQLLGV
jgi:hypothetical protein